MTVIDTHCHVASNDSDAYPQKPLSKSQSGWIVNRPTTTEQLLEQMDNAGIEKAIIVQPAAVYGFDNSYAADSVDAHPDRFVGICTVPFLAADAVQLLEHWIEERHFAGVRVRPGDGVASDEGDIRSLDDAAAHDAWSYVEDHQIPVSVQATPKDIAQVEKLIEQFPRLLIALDHCVRSKFFAQPEAPETAAFFRLARHKSLYLKLTTVPLHQFNDSPLGVTSAVRLLMNHFGAQRIMWGSNFPASEGSLDEMLELANTGLTESTAEERGLVFSKSALSLYPTLRG